MMLMRILAALFLCFVTVTALDAALNDPFVRKTTYRPNNALPYIKVLLAKGLENPIIEVQGKYHIYNPHDDSLLTQGYLGKKYPLQTLPHGIKWGEEFLDIFQIAIVPDNSKGFVLVNGTAYRGILYIYDINDKLYLVNELPIEEYVKTYLAAHLCNQQLDEEVFEAAAIVARTKAYYERLSAKNANWHVDAQEVGLRGYFRPENFPRIRQAVVATQGMVMRVKDIREKAGLFPARWTENCGGKTVSPSLVFNNYAPHIASRLEGVESPIAAVGRENSKWSFSINRSALTNLVEMDSASHLGILTDEFSDKVYALRFENGNEHKDVDFLTLQELLGERLKSNQFNIELNGEMVVFTGYGKGNGVGLCLYSAEQMAQNGAFSPQIISKFFPNTELVIMPTLYSVQPVSNNRM